MHWLTPLPGQGAGAFSWKLPTPPPDMTKMMLAAGQAALEKGVEFGIAAGEAGYGAAKVGADVTMKGAKLAGQAGVVAAQAGYEGAKVGADVTLKVGTKAAELGVAAAVVGAEGTVVAVKYTAKRTKGAVHKTHKLGIKAAGHFERYSETPEEGIDWMGQVTGKDDRWSAADHLDEEEVPDANRQTLGDVAEDLGFRPTAFVRTSSGDGRAMSVINDEEYELGVDGGGGGGGGRGHARPDRLESSESQDSVRSLHSHGHGGPGGTGKFNHESMIIQSKHGHVGL